MKNFKLIALIVLSIIFLAIGVLGIAKVNSFTSSVGLEIIEIFLGIGGLIAATQRPKDNSIK